MMRMKYLNQQKHIKVQFLRKRDERNYGYYGTDSGK